MKYLGKIQDDKDLVTKEYVDKGHILQSKTFTDIIGTANNISGASFAYGKLTPESYYKPWHIVLRVKVEAAGSNYAQATSIWALDGVENTYISYSCQNAIHSTSYRPVYYNIYWRFNKAAIDANGCHYIGLALNSSWNPITAANKRTATIEVLETDNCTFEFLNSLITYSTVTEYSNYNTYTSFDFATNGLQETGDANDVNYQNREYYTSRKTNSALYRYQICFTKSDGSIVPTNSVNNSIATNKTLTTDTFDPFGDIFQWVSTSTYSAGANIGNAYLYRQYLCDLRYSFNCGGYDAAGTLTARSPLYLVTVPQNDDTVKLHSAPLAEALPSTDDGLVYIYLGRVYEDTYPYRVVLSPKHPVYWYKEGHIQPYVKGLNGHTVNKDVPSDAVFTDTDTKVTAVGNHYTPSGGTTTSASGATGTSGITVQVVTGVTKDAAGHVTGITSGAATDTTYSSKAAASGGTAVSLVTTGEKYTWNNKQNALTNPVTGTGTSGYLAKFNGTSTITSGLEYDDNNHLGLYNDDYGIEYSDQGLILSDPYDDYLIEPWALVTDSKSAASGGTDLSLVSTGEKYNWNNKQDVLESGTNIKTINNTSLLGSGNISISGGGSKNIWYATCSTAASTIAKVVTTTSSDFELTTGNMLRVLFTYANSASAPTLTVDSKTAKSVRVVRETSGAQYHWQAGETVDFVYDGTYFLMVDRAPATTTYYGPTKLSSSTSSTSTSLAATPSAVKSAYDLADGKQDALTTETISISSSDFTTTTGKISSVELKRYGNVVQLSLQVTKTTATAAGSNVYEGTLNLTNYRPLITTECGSYSGQICVIGLISTDGSILARVTGAQLPADRTPRLTFVYLI